MLTWVAIATFLLAIVLAIRWRISRPDALGRRRGFPTVAIPLLLVISAATGWVTYSHHQLEQRLSAVASELVGRPVSVHCQTFGEAFLDAGADSGYVVFTAKGTPEPKTLIKRDTCNALRAFDSSTGAAPPSEQLVAVHVLTHESMHMRGEMNEASTECQAMQRDAITARLLGAREADAAQLVRRYWIEIYPTMPADYQSAECAEGRRLDESLADAPWSKGS